MKTKLNSAAVFVETVDRGSITKGALARNITRSAASKSISQLEQSLDVQLLNRNTRNLSLTEAGRIYYEKVKIALNTLEAAEQEITSRNQEPSGVLKVSTTIVFGRLYLTRIVAAFLQQFPKVIVDMSVTDEHAEPITDGVDIFFRTGIIEQPNMIAKKLSDVSFRTVASPDYLQRAEKPKHIGDLAAHNCLNYKFPTNGRVFEWRFRTEGNTQFHHFSGNFISDDVGEVHRMTLGGNGIAQLPGEMVAEDVQNKRLVELFPKSVFPSSELFMCYPQTKKRDPKVKHFKEFILNWMGTSQPM